MKLKKYNGEIVPYEPNKIRESLMRAGASDADINAVIEQTEREATDGITTKALYQIVYRNLKNIERSLAARYDLKKSIMRLGPSGFPFEQFVAELLKQEGFETITGQMVEGHCVTHEVDVVASNSDKRWMIECKFHSREDRVCNIQHALYVHARFFDIEKAWLQIPSEKGKQLQGWLVTNTRMTSEAEKYGTCAGLGLISWDFPVGSSLRERVDKTGLHPITCLPSLTRREKEALLEKKIVLCKNIQNNPEMLYEIGLRPAKQEQVMNEVEKVCHLP